MLTLLGSLHHVLRRLTRCVGAIAGFVCVALPAVQIGFDSRCRPPSTVDLGFPSPAVAASVPALGARP